MKYFKMILVFLITGFKSYSNILTIKNDSKNKIIVEDPIKKDAVIIESDKSAKMDTSLTGIKKWFLIERLNFYVLNPKTGAYDKKYRLNQNYSNDKNNNLTFSQIKDFVNKPTEEFNAVEFET